MTLDGELQTLCKGLQGMRVNVPELLKHNLDITALWVGMPTNHEKKVLQWAVEKYKVKPEYVLKSKSGASIGTVKIDKPLSIEAKEYNWLVEKLDDIGVKLSPQSYEVLQHLAGVNGYNALDAYDIVLKARGKKSAIEAEFLKEKFGIQEPEYKEFSDNLVISQTISPELISYGVPRYNVEPTIFGTHALDSMAYSNVVMDGYSQSELKINTIELFQRRESPIKNKAKAVKVLITLAQHVV